MRAYLVLLLTAFVCSLAFCAIQIPLLKRLHTGQNILEYVKEHRHKGGTPTMGGLGFILSASLCALFLVSGKDKPFYVALTVGVAYLFVGFIDDLLKKLHGENLGLRAYQKILFQLTVAIFASIYCCKSGLTKIYFPFTQTFIDLGWWTLPLGIFLFLATVNSVNLTDGLDGLAGSVSGAFFFVFSILIALQGGSEPLSKLSVSLVGALLAYLLFNTNRASIFMGDTGSLSLGGFASAIALFSGNALYLPFVGGMFVLSSISVIIQVIYYKKTGKRVFLMSPIHHHFQQKGYSESKIAYAYTLFTLIVGGVCILPFV